jgi:hypothetical protein
MIPLVKEPDELFQASGIYENCYFCGKLTPFWHEKTNQPVCRPCSRIHNEEEVIPAWEDYKNLKKEKDGRGQKGIYL